MTNQEKADLFCKDWLQGKSTFSITTSGSTGIPKTIELSRGQLTRSAEKTIHALGLRGGMTSLVCLDVNFIAGKMMLVRSMLAGLEMIVVEPKANPLEDIDKSIDFTAMVPYQVMNSTGSKFSGKIIVGGGPVSFELLEKIKRIDHAIFYATFGMTETISHIALQRLNGNDPQQHFHTLDGVEIGQDDRQCLIIKADHLDEIIITNDIVDIISPHEFKWLGRYDNVINSGGIKVIPEKVEQVVSSWLNENGLDNNFFVTGMDHDRLGKQVVLVIEGAIFRETEAKLVDELRAKLDKYEVPKKVLYNTAFVMTATGKINRKLSLENALPRPGS